MKDQPDFVVTINGTDVTTYCRSWEVNEVEDAISNMTVTIVNPDIKMGFKAGDKVSIRFGTEGAGMSPKVEMTIDDYSEEFAEGGIYIIATGRDCQAKMSGVSMRGQFQSNDAKKCIEELGKTIKAKMELGDMNSPVLDKEKKIAVHCIRADLLARELLNKCEPKKKGGGGSVGKGKGKHIKKTLS